MKKNLVYIWTLFIFSIIACKGKNSQTSNSQSVDTSVKTSVIKSEIVDTTPPKITVKMFKHSGLDFDSEGFCMNPMVSEVFVTEVKKIEDGKVFKCSEGQYIQKMIVQGNASAISIVFLNGKGKEIYRQNDFSLSGEISFSAINRLSEDEGRKEKKDKDFAAWFESAEKMNILYKGKVIKEIKWKNNGWYRQPQVSDEMEE
jgi:hypothetical protein